MFYILCLIVSIIISSCSCSPVVEEAAPLKITEVGSTYYNDSSVWFEIYNPTNVSVNLKNYTLRCFDYQGNIRIFYLPSITVHPGSYVIIRGKPYMAL